MARPELWLIAGPNGAGKTTLVQAAPISELLPHVRFVNSDDIALAKLRDLGYQGFADAPPALQQQAFVASANEVLETVRKSLERGEAVGVETVLSTDKYRPLVEMVEEHDGFVGLIYVSLSSPELAQRRIGQHIARGGHDVPEEGRSAMAPIA